MKNILIKTFGFINAAFGSSSTTSILGDLVKFIYIVDFL